MKSMHPIKKTRNKKYKQKFAFSFFPFLYQILQLSSKNIVYFIYFMMKEISLEEKGDKIQETLS